MKLRVLAVCALCLSLAACATGPIYRPAMEPGGYGYRDTMLTSTQFRVSFSGADGVARETVDNFALFRAADVALMHGADTFRVVSRETSPITTSEGYGSTFGFGYGGWGYPFWNAGFGYAPNYYNTATRFQTVLIIQVGSDVPENGPNVYNARQIKENLAPEVAAAQN